MSLMNSQSKIQHLVLSSSKQQYLLTFWEGALRHVMKNYFHQTSISALHLKQAFILNRFEPLGFNDVLVSYQIHLVIVE